MPVTYHSLVQATPGLARRVDRAEIEFCAMAARHGAHGASASLEAGGGLALYGAPGSPLNKVLGLGLGCDVTDADLDAVEAFYEEREAAVQIELCPLAQASLPSRLCARGYSVLGFENELARTLEGPPRPAPDSPGVRVERIGAGQDDLWVRVTARGFAVAETVDSTAEPAEIDGAALEAIMSMMRNFTHPALKLYLAFVGDEPAGGGATWVCDGVLGICGTATDHRMRRRGVQRAINQRALVDAPREADLAIATVAPGSVSQRNFERLGFQVLYTRAMFVKSVAGDRSSSQV